MKLLKKGIKDHEGNYFPVNYSHSKNYGYPNFDREVVVIYSKNYKGFSESIKNEINVINNSESMADQFEKDKIILEKNTKIFNQAILNCN